MVRCQVLLIGGHIGQGRTCKWNILFYWRELQARGGTLILNRRGCSSEILNLTPKGDHLGVAQAFCGP